MPTIPRKERKYVLSRHLDIFFLGIYNVLKFIGRFFREALLPPFEIKEILRQCFRIGVQSLALISVTGFITGLVFTKQSRPSLSEFGAQSWLPSLAAVAVVRALAPLITALIGSGKIGSGIGAELASMRVTEQIDAMEASATRPFRFLVVSRIAATTLMIPILMLYTAFIGLLGGYLNIHSNEQTSLTAFIQAAFATITFLDIFAALIKSIIFGFTIGVVGAYQGYNASGGTEGVGRAANTAVVISMFLIFIEEMILVQITNWFR